MEVVGGQNDGCTAKSGGVRAKIAQVPAGEGERRWKKGSGRWVPHVSKRRERLSQVFLELKAKGFAEFLYQANMVLIL